MKKILILFMAMCVATIVNAQTRNMAGSSRFLDNWSVGVSGGIQTNLHDWNSPNGAFWGVELNKQVTPIFGLTAEVGMGLNNNSNWVCDVLYEPVWRHSALSHNGTAIENMYTYLDGRVNITNAFWKYKGTPRLVEVEALAGLGYGHAYDNVNGDALLSKLGANVNFNLGKEKAWTVSVRPSVVWNTSATGKYDCRHAVGQITAGVVYHFKNKSNKKHYMDAYTVPSPVETIIEKVVEKVVEKPVVTKETVNTVEYVNTVYTVYFAQNKSVLTETAKSVLNQIKSGTNVVVDGYASPEGSVRRNNELSFERAKAVRDYLETRGINVTSVNACGAVGNESGRVAIVTINK